MTQPNTPKQDDKGALATPMVAKQSKDSKSVTDYVAQGYRIVSRKYGIISRIDRDDWKEYMAEEHAPWDIEEGREWVLMLGDLHAADHYRRVYSKDTLEIGQKALRLKIPNSGDLL